MHMTEEQKIEDPAEKNSGSCCLLELFILIRNMPHTNGADLVEEFEVIVADQSWSKKSYHILKND